MARLEEYRLAMLPVRENCTKNQLIQVLNSQEPGFSDFVISHGLGPLWHAQTGSKTFKASRHAAEALYLAQERALADVSRALDQREIVHAVIKGAATRLLVYDDHATRACLDLDVLVSPEDRVRAAEALVAIGFSLAPKSRNISHALELSRDRVNVDLHWGLLREGRLRRDLSKFMLARRRRHADIFILHPDDALFLMLVHPAFAKHLSGWNMGLHRVADILRWLRMQPVDWRAVLAQLRDNGVLTAAWATLSWVQMLSDGPELLEPMLDDTAPGPLRRRWLDYWLRSNLSLRLASHHWLRLTLFTSLLHDKPQDALRALRGRSRALRRRKADMESFEELLR
jgi:hypothetical protein